MSIVSKIMQAVVQVMPDRAPDELREAHRYIGQPISRLDGRDKVTGKARYSAEYPVEGLTHAAMAFSTIPKGKIRSIDSAAAEAAVGVVAVITHLNAPRMKAPPLIDPSGSTNDLAGTRVNALNTDEISWNGQPVAVVVADTLERAEHAASLITFTYDEEPAVLSFEEAQAHAVKPTNVMGEDTEVKHGDAEAALAKAAFQVDENYVTPRYNHNPIEPNATTVAWDGDGTS